MKDQKNYKGMVVEIGSTGTFDLDGVVRDPVIPELGGSRGRQIYSKMRADATVSAIIFAIEMMLRRSKWGCSPIDTKNQKAVEYAEFFESLRDDMSITWEHFISNVLSMLTYGWSFFEIVAKRRLGYDAEVSSKHKDGLWGIRKLAFRPQSTLDSWGLDENGNVKSMIQQIYYGYQSGKKEIPITKGLLFRAGFWNDSPEGMSPLRGAYEPWKLLQGINRAEAYGIERELNGLPVVRIPADILRDAENGDADAAAVVTYYKQIVRDLRLNRQAGVIIPSDYYQNADGTLTAQKQYELLLLASNGTRSINVQAAAERHQVSIARCVLADFLMLGTTSRSGSQALGESRFQFFANALDGWNDSIAEVLNRFLVPRIARMNGFDMELLPRYQTESVNPIDVEKLVNCIEKYVRAGGTLLPDSGVDEAVRSELGLPIADPAIQQNMQYDPTLDPRNTPLGGENANLNQSNGSNTSGNGE